MNTSTEYHIPPEALRQKLGQHRLSPGAEALAQSAEDAARRVRTALDGTTTWVATRRAAGAALEAVAAFTALAAALPLEALRMRARDRHARKLASRIRASNARIRAERARAERPKEAA